MVNKTTLNRSATDTGTEVTWATSRFSPFFLKESYLINNQSSFQSSASKEGDVSITVFLGDIKVCFAIAIAIVIAIAIAIVIAIAIAIAVAIAIKASWYWIYWSFSFVNKT